MLDLVGDAASETFQALVRRARHGPLQPGWPARTEIAVGVLRRIMRRSERRGIPWLRGVQGRTPQADRVLRRVTFAPVTTGGVPGLTCTPDEGPATRTLLYLHGGGYVIGGADVSREFMAHMAVGLGARVVTPEYRLAPEHPFPAAQQDGIAAYRALLAEGVEPARLAVGGDSAGGGLTLATLLQARDAGDPLPAAGLLLCPWVDPTARGGSLDANAATDFLYAELLRSWFETALAGGDPADPLWAPARAALPGLPPLVVQWGGAEVLCDQIRAFVAAARAAGVDVDAHEWEEMFHDWMLMGPLAPQAEPALRELVAALDARLAR